MNLRKLLLVSALTSPGLIACAGPPSDLSFSDDQSDSPAADGDFVHLDLEVVGEGQLALLEPYVETCSTADGICSFVFERGTRVVFEAEVVVGADGEVIVDCSGLAACALDLDQSLTIVADFETRGGRIAGDRAFGYLPGAPWIIVDPFLGQNGLHRAASADSLQRVTEE